jgi:uncharacterized membrane protein affecting hemolysin expression
VSAKTKSELPHFLDKISLSQQLAVITAVCCLLVSIALVVLGAISSRHIQQAQLQEFGSALASQVARRVSNSLETGDLLSAAASLQRFVEASSAEQVELFDVEGKTLGQAGVTNSDTALNFSADVEIEGDVAGLVVVTISTDNARAGQRRLIFSLTGLAILLSALVFGATRMLGQRHADRLLTLGETITLEDSSEKAVENNELRLLEHRIAQLPMDLLRTQSAADPADDSYQNTAVLYLHLTSLAEYADTLDEGAMHRYTHRLHQIVYAAAGFYGGEIHVSRQYGLALYFRGTTNTGSAAFSAASCAWLIKSTCNEVEKLISRSLSVAMAINSSEMGTGDAGDIYPSLYLQITIDELQELCSSRPPKILLSPAVCADTDVEGRLVQHATELRDYGMLDGFAGPYQDLLERQLRLIMRRFVEERA